MNVFHELVYQLRYALPVWFLGVLTNWWPMNRVTMRIRGVLYRPFFGECGPGLQLASDVRIINSHRMRLGSNVYIGHGTWLNGMGELAIEDEVVIGPYVVISTLSHRRQNGSFRFGGSTAAPVRLGRGCWLGAHVSVKCGVQIGRGCSVGANAMVTKDLPDDSFAGGVPARCLRTSIDVTVGRRIGRWGPTDE